MLLPPWLCPKAGVLDAPKAGAAPVWPKVLANPKAGLACCCCCCCCGWPNIGVPPKAGAEDPKPVAAVGAPKAGVD